MKKLFAQLLGCVMAMLLSFAAHGADVLVFDSFTGATTYTTTGGSPRTFIGYPFNASNAAGATPSISKITVYLAFTGTVTTSYTNIRANFQFWDTWASASSPVFAGPAAGGPFFADLGPVTLTPGTYTPVDITLGTPLPLAGLVNHGFVVNWQGDTGSGLTSSDTLTSLLRYGTNPIAVGSSPLANSYGYRNVGGQTTFNFNSTDSRSFSQTNEAMVFKLYAVAPPTVTIDQAAGQVDPTSASPVSFTVVFSEPVNGFTASDISFTGSTVGGTLVAAVSGAGPTYTVTVTGMTTSGTVVASIAAGAATSVANGQASTASTSTDNTVTYTDAAPTVTIDQAAGQVDPTTSSPINFTVVFSEAVSGFTAADIAFTGSTVGGTLLATVTGGPSTYNVAVTGMTTSGSVVASIAAGAANDSVGNPSTASTSTDNTVTYTDAPPSVTINQAAGQVDPTTGSPINFTVVFSEPVTGFAANDISFTGSTVGGTLSAAVTGGPSTYNVAVTGMTTSGTVVATIAAGAANDSVGNPSTASTSIDNTVTYTDAPPSVTINQAAGQVDPTTSSPINFTVVFSEAVSGFTAADIAFAGSTVGGTLSAAVTGGPSTYNVAVTGMTTSGTVVASIAAGAVTDSVGNPNTASTSTDNSVTYTDAPPAVTINQAAGQPDPTSNGSIAFTVTFSEPVTGFAASGVSFAGSTAGGTLVATVTGGPTVYTVTVSGMTTSGTVVVSLNAGAAVDSVGNPSAASTSTDRSVTYQAVVAAAVLPVPATTAGGIALMSVLLLACAGFVTRRRYASERSTPRI